VHAYDLNPEALRLCREMAALNRVAERVLTGSFCDPAALKAIPFAGRALIVCDCEGYEKKLFTGEIAAFLAGHDVLVELHDGVDITISTYIQRLFEPTHCIEVIESLDDIKKARIYAYPELESFDCRPKKCSSEKAGPTLWSGCLSSRAARFPLHLPGSALHGSHSNNQAHRLFHHQFSPPALAAGAGQNPGAGFWRGGYRGIADGLPAY